MNETDFFGDEMGYSGRQGKLLHLSSMVDLESRLSVGCAGAVLTCLHRRKAVTHLIGADDTQSMFKISAILMFNLDETMYVTATEMILSRVLIQEGGLMPIRWPPCKYFKPRLIHRLINKVLPVRLLVPRKVFRCTVCSAL